MQQKIEIQKRIAWVDYAKAIGIVLIVIGHLTLPGLAVNYLWTFHVPLFFFVSGYLFDNTKTTKAFLKSTFLHLLIPYVGLYVFLVFYEAYMWNALNLDFIKPRLFAIVYGTHSCPGFIRVPLWFLPSLMTVQILYFFIIRRNLIYLLFFLVISVCLFYNGYLNLFFSIDLSLLALNFFCVGIIAKKYLQNVASQLMPIPSIIGALFLSLVVYEFASFGNVWYAGKYYSIAFLGGLIGIAMIVLLSFFLERCFGNLGFIRFISKNTILILAFHMDSNYFATKILEGPIDSLPFMLKDVIIALTSICLLIPVILLFNIILPEISGKKRMGRWFGFKSELFASFGVNNKKNN